MPPPRFMVDSVSALEGREATGEIVGNPVFIGKFEGPEEHARLANDPQERRIGMKAFEIPVSGQHRAPPGIQLDGLAQRGKGTVAIVHPEQHVCKCNVCIVVPG